jgi:hypothetical protein
MADLWDIARVVEMEDLSVSAKVDSTVLETVAQLVMNSDNTRVMIKVES